MRRDEIVPRLAVVAALAALVAGSCWVRWAALTSSPFPLGVDGWYYAVQVRELLATGDLAYPASPLVFWLAAPIAAVSDPITAVKLVAAVGGALIAVPAYAVGARLGGGRGAGLVAAAIATTSAGSAYLSSEFVKNGVGLTIAVAALWAVLRALEAPGRGRAAVAIGGVLAAALAHKMAAGLVVAIALPAYVAEAVGRGALRGRRLLYVIGALVVVGLLAVLGMVFPHALLSPADAALLDGLWTTRARWQAPALANAHATLALGHEALLGGVAALALLGLRAVRGSRPPPPPRPRAGVAAAGWAVAGLALVLGLPWLDVSDAQGLAFRLRLAAFVPLALTCAALCRAVPLRHRDLALAALAAVIALAAPTDRRDGRVATHPALVTAALALRGPLAAQPPGTVAIVPERHIAFLVRWYTGAEVRLRPDDVPAARRVRVLPLSFIGAGSALDRALLAARTRPAPPVGGHPLHANGLVVVPEATWQWCLGQVPLVERARWAAWPVI